MLPGVSSRTQNPASPSVPMKNIGTDGGPDKRKRGFLCLSISEKFSKMMP